MPVPVYSGQFKRDIKRMQRRGKDMEKFKEAARLLLAGMPSIVLQGPSVKGRMGKLQRPSY